MNFKMLYVRLLLVGVFCVIVTSLFSQNIKTMELNLHNAVRLALDSSRNAQIIKHEFLSGYWQYKAHRASLLPELSLKASPMNYYRYMTKQYNFVSEKYQYVEQKFLNSDFELGITQVVPLTGGKFSIASGLTRMDNFGDSRTTDFSSVPLSVSYSQSLFGFNSYKWDSKIEDANFATIKKEYLYKIENLKTQVVDHFFELASAKVALEIEEINLANADTLLRIAQRRFEIASVTKAELLNFRIDYLNAQNNLALARNDYFLAQQKFVSFVGLPVGVEVVPLLTDSIAHVVVNENDALNMASNNSSYIAQYEQKILHTEYNTAKALSDSRLDADLSVTFGLNQSADKFDLVYQNPMNRQVVSLSLEIPIFDWGRRKSNFRKSMCENLAVKLSVEQAIVDFYITMLEDVRMFNLRFDMISTAVQTALAADEAYKIIKQQYIIGKAGLSDLNLYLTKQNTTKRNLVGCFRDYWLYFYKLRQMTLYDFVDKKDIDVDYDVLLKN